MNYCHHCGVELDNNMTDCPLCGLPAGQEQAEATESTSNHPPFKDKILSEINHLTIAQKRKLFWEISTIILGSGIIVTLIINIIENGNISWAKYSLVASLFVFANISFFTLWRSRPVLMVLGSFISAGLLLMLLDLLSFNIGWGVRLGIPVVVSIYILLILVWWLISISHQHGFNILAMIFLALGLLLISIEASITHYYQDSIRLSWSIIAAACMIPISAMLFFVHYKLKKGTELRRFFHI